MECTVDILKDGNVVTAMLPFNAREAFSIPKGSIYAQCEIGSISFQTKLLARGGGNFCVLFNAALLKKLGVDGEARSVCLKIEPREAEAPRQSEPALILNNDTLQTIAARRSIRAFTGDTIGDDALTAILNAGFNAPSASNKRPLHFIVTRDREKMLWLTDHSPYVKMLKNAAASVVICGDKVVQGIQEWLLADSSAAAQNMLIAITSLSLGGCWCGVRQGTDFYRAVAEVFSLPEHIRPMALIAIGVPAETKPENALYNEARIHREVW
jgi:nitroreductase